MSEQGVPCEWAEADRLAALRSYDILDTPPEPDFDSLARLAAQVCQTPVALVSLVDDRRQWFKAEIGLGLRETSLVESICATAILQPDLLIVPDTALDHRFDDNPVVRGEPHLRFYAGARLQTSAGLPLGALCVLDRLPREGLTADQQFALTTLARQVMAQLELRRALKGRDEALAASRRISERQALLVRELHHRVRNTLALVQSLLGSTARTSSGIDEFYSSFSARIAALARTQTLLTEDYWQTASLKAMLEQELKPFLDHPQGRVRLAGADLALSADIAIPIGMALHELASNAVRHGALSIPAGRVEVTWDLRTDQNRRTLCLTWVEADGPPVREPVRRGFGSTLLQRVLTMQANAKVELRYDSSGLTFAMEAPLVEQRLVPEY